MIVLDPQAVITDEDEVDLVDIVFFKPIQGIKHRKRAEWVSKAAKEALQDVKNDDLPQFMLLTIEVVVKLTRNSINRHVSGAVENIPAAEVDSGVTISNTDLDADELSWYEEAKSCMSPCVSNEIIRKLK